MIKPHKLLLISILLPLLNACSDAEDHSAKEKTSQYQGGQAEAGDGSTAGIEAGSTESDQGSVDNSGAGTSDTISARASCKRGGAYGYHSELDLKAVSKGSAWWYNWALTPDKDVATSYSKLGMEFVPMLWNGNFTVADAVKKIPADAKYLLAFNEPNFKSQGNLSPAQAAARWPEVESIAKQRNLKIVSPAVNYCGPAANCHETDPYVYLDKFFAACKDCKVDYIAVHWYACKAEYLTNYLKGFEKYKKPLWVTEFSCGDGDAAQKSLAGQKAYMDEAIKVLESNPLVYRYSWFASRTTAIPNVDLLGASGELTDLGKQYETTATKVAGACDL